MHDLNSLPFHHLTPFQVIYIAEEKHAKFTQKSKKQKGYPPFHAILEPRMILALSINLPDNVNLNS